MPVNPLAGRQPPSANGAPPAAGFQAAVDRAGRTEAQLVQALPLPIVPPPPGVAQPGALPPGTARGLEQAGERALRRLGHVAGEIGRGSVGSAAGHLLGLQPYPPEVDDPTMPRLADPAPGASTTATPPPAQVPSSPPPLTPPEVGTQPEGFTPAPVRPSDEGFTPAPAGPQVEGMDAAGPAGPQAFESQRDPGLIRPTGEINGRPTGLRSTTRENASSKEKAQRDSENQVADALASAGYRTVQNPTEGSRPNLTPERLQAEGLRPNADPDLLVENRIWDTYTPVEDRADSIRTGIQRKIEEAQTHRVVVDLRGTTQTEASVRAAMRERPLSGVREVMFLTHDGLSRPFRP